MPSREIFELRRSGRLVEGYDLGKQNLQTLPLDVWVLKAFTYCTLDLARQSASNGDYVSAQSFLKEITKLTSENSFADEVLVRYINTTEQQVNPENKDLVDARNASRSGDREQALRLYRQVVQKFPDNIEAIKGLGWELYHQIKKLTDTENINFAAVRGLLREYMRLKSERPSMLHSRMLNFAIKISDQDDFSDFVAAWDLKNLREEDYEPYVNANKNYPSLAERAVQRAAKKATEANADVRASNYILPFLDSMIDRSTENQWLVYYKAKILNTVGRQDDALFFTINFVKSKISEFWSWGLLADVVARGGDTAAALSCYCKSLLCKTDDEFLGKIRLSLAKILIATQDFDRAKYEVSKIVSTSERNGWNINHEVSSYVSSMWYENTTCPENNTDFYQLNTSIANNLVFSLDPWRSAVLGECFHTDQNPPKKRRKIYILIDDHSTPLEISLPEKKYDFSGMAVGSGLSVKGDFDSTKNFTVYLLEKRNSDMLWDVFSDQIGVIDHVNYEKGIFHFIVNQNINGIFRFKKEDKIDEGCFIAVKVSHFYKRDGTLGCNAASFKKTDKQPNTAVFRSFNECVQHENNGLAFTQSGIFIDRGLTRQNHIEENSLVDGFAVLNFNRRKSTWGWKAIRINSVNGIDDEFLNSF